MPRPPYLPLWEWDDGILNLSLNISNYLFLLEDELYLAAYLSSVRIAFFATLITLLVGYPMAYWIARGT